MLEELDAPGARIIVQALAAETVLWSAASFCFHCSRFGRTGPEL